LAISLNIIITAKPHPTGGGLVTAAGQTKVSQTLKSA